MEPSWEGKSSQDRPRQAKTKEDKGSEGKGRERKRKGRDWKGKVWKSVAGVISRAGGEGFARPLGGDLPSGSARAGVGDSEGVVGIPPTRGATLSGLNR